MIGHRERVRFGAAQQFEYAQAVSEGFEVLGTRGHDLLAASCFV